MTEQTKQQIRKASRFLIKKTLQQLAKIEKGVIHWEDGEQLTFGKPHNNLQAKVIIYNDAFYQKFIWRGSIGAAESYIDGDWDCDNLTALTQIIIENESVLMQLEKGLSIFGHVFRTIKNLIVLNGIKRSKRNIKYHYDLSNELFNTFLDKTMMYSSAVFEKEDDLEAAQLRKLSTICEKLKLNASDHVLEIGSGWGGLAIYAAQHYGCKVTTTTISDEQYDYVSKKIAELSLSDKIQVIKKDYRELTGEYDKLVSIEMIESIGHHYFKKYFSVCNRLLKKKGLFLLQAITIKDEEYRRYRREVDFIKAYIFPGGCLPSHQLINKLVSKNTAMKITEVTDIGQHYATTLAVWRSRFLANEQKIRALGFGDEFIKMFYFYFCYCEGGFLSSYISNLHVVMEKS